MITAIVVNIIIMPNNLPIMQVMAIDVGTGTQDVLLYDSDINIENNVKMVLPSQTVTVAKKIRRSTRQGRSLFLTGEIMGGGPSSSAIREHLMAKLSVYATPLAAKTLNDNLDKVASWGVQIVSEGTTVERAIKVELKDVDARALRSLLRQFDVEVPDTFAVACQDHGESYESNRRFRFQHFEEMIERGGDLKLFSYLNGKIPNYLTRMHAVYRTLKHEGVNEVLLMDTGPAAIFGALCDEVIKKRLHMPIILVNIGNGHILSAMLHREQIVGMFEHHTSAMHPDKLDYYISLFESGELTNEYVFNDGGHGCYINDRGFEDLCRAYKERGFFVSVTGPKRNMMRESIHNPYFAVPYGDMMLTGCFGLIKAFYGRIY
jgi:uncharacterized protein (DUF1786 family)